MTGHLKRKPLAGPSVKSQESNFETAKPDEVPKGLSFENLPATL